MLLRQWSALIVARVMLGVMSCLLLINFQDVMRAIPRNTYNIMTVQLKVILGFHCILYRVVGRFFDALRYVC